MTRARMDSLANVKFDLNWTHSGITYEDTYYARGVNLWRDWLPERIRDTLRDAPVGQKTAIELTDEGPARQQDDILSLKPAQFDNRFRPDTDTRPQYGRFYPQGMLKGLPNIFKSNLKPFRIVDVQPGTIRADLNHPLSGKDLRLSIELARVIPKIDERGGTSVDWIETLTSGPGMQARVNGKPTAFFVDDPFVRVDETPDQVFYQSPRLVSHLDATARKTVAGLYGRLLKPHTRVLDLMSSWQSHLPEDLDVNRVTGLGLNQAELEANPRLSDYRVHDLNQNPVLPFDDESYDAVVCTASIEYLIHPFEVFAQVARVLRPGGVFAVSFSNRWFSPKAIGIWSDLHEYERLGLVAEYFQQSGRFTDLAGFSVRGLPRPVDDKYYAQNRIADPIYAIAGKKGGH